MDIIRVDKSMPTLNAVDLEEDISKTDIIFINVNSNFVSRW